MVNDVGNITASLKLESAAFIREMTKASQATAKSTASMSRSFSQLDTRIAAAGKNIRNTIIGFASVAGIRSFVNLGKAAITMADEVASSARRMGVSAEELQRFRFAADQADVQLGELTAAFRVFQKQLATGKVTSPGGSITEQFLNFLEKIEDTEPTKRFALALTGFSKQAGAAMGIVNAGVDEFRANMDRAVVVSNRLVATGDSVDDTMASIGQAITAGFATGILETFSSDLNLSKQSMESLAEVTRVTTNAIVTGFGLIAVAIKGAIELWNDLDQNIREWNGTAGGSSDFAKNIAAGTPGAFRGAAKTGGGGGGGVESDPVAKIGAWKTATEDLVSEQVRLGESLASNATGPLEQYRQAVDALSRAQEYGKITAEQMGVAQTQAAATAIMPWLDVASTISGALGTLFDDNKAVAIAQAIINTAQGITAALAQYPPPLSFAMAAAQAAAGAAQIATIKSARPGGGRTPSVKGGSGRAATKESTQQTTPTQQDRAVFVSLQGSGRYTREEVLHLIDGLIEAQKDGARLVLAGQ